MEKNQKAINHQFDIWDFWLYEWLNQITFPSFLVVLLIMWGWWIITQGRIRGHVSDNCHYIFLLYKYFREKIKSCNYDFSIFLAFTKWYIASTFFWKISSNLLQSTKGYNTMVVLFQKVIYPPNDLPAVDITKWPKIGLQETSIYYCNYLGYMKQ